MAKDGAIELQQPLDCAHGASGASDAAKYDVAYHHGNEHDQADMDRLGKKQRLDAREATIWDSTRYGKLTSAAQLSLDLRPRSHMHPHGDMGDHVYVGMSLARRPVTR